jgi:hypothetical protein
MLEDVKTLEQQMVVRIRAAQKRLSYPHLTPSNSKITSHTQRSSEALDEERERLIIMAKEMDARADTLPAEMDDYINASLPLVIRRPPFCAR